MLLLLEGWGLQARQGQGVCKKGSKTMGQYRVDIGFTDTGAI